MSQEFSEAVGQRLLPEEPVGPKGGRPRIHFRTRLRTAWHIPATSVAGAACRTSSAAQIAPPTADIAAQFAERGTGYLKRLHAMSLRLVC
jgi:hypothetical protein